MPERLTQRVGIELSDEQLSTNDKMESVPTEVAPSVTIHNNGRFRTISPVEFNDDEEADWQIAVRRPSGKQLGS